MRATPSTHRSRTLAAIVAMLLVAYPRTGVAQSLSRAQAVQQALTANPEVKVSLERVAILEGQITQELAEALPEVNWWTSWIRSRDPGLLNSPNFDAFPIEFRTALRPIPGNVLANYASVRQTIFSFEIGGAIKAAKLGRSSAEVDVRRARQVTALEAIQAYNGLLFATEQLSVDKATLEQKEGHLEVARNRRAAGAATELEVLRAEVDVENQRAELFKSETLVTAARSRLNTVMLRPTETPVEPSDVLDQAAVNVTLDQALKEALDSRPELESLRIEAQIRDTYRTVIAADMKPRLDFDGLFGFSVREPRNAFNFDFTRWSAAVTVKVPLFDGHRVKGRLVQNQAERNIVTQRIVALENQIRLDVQNTWDTLALADRVLRAADLNVTQAQRALDMTSANYRLGAATPLDVLDAQQALAMAANIRNRALFTHANARASLSFEMGRDPLTNAVPATP